MKKILIIIVVFIFLNTIYNITHTEHIEEVSLKESPVFKIDEYNVFYLDLEEEDITTLDLNLFDNMDILSINLHVNPLYKDKIGNIKYRYQNLSQKRNIEDLTKQYINTIKDNGIIEDFNYLKVTGIKIDQIEVYSKGTDIINLIYKKRKIKYHDYLNNTFDYLKF